MRLKIFVLSPNIPKPDVNAGDRRFLVMLQMLAAQHDVDLCVINHEDRGASIEFKTELQRYRTAVENLNVRLIPFGWRHIEAVLLKTNYDVVFYEFYHVAQRYQKLVNQRQPAIKSIVDTVDVHFARKQAGAELGVGETGEAEQTKRAELAVYNAADAVIAASDLDQELLVAENVTGPLYLIPILVDVAPQVFAPAATEILFVGGFDHEPNLDGILWLVENIWPRVLESVADAHLSIVGSRPRPEILALNEVQGVEVRGYVSDSELAQLLRQTAVSIAPLRYGAGMKGKVVEALAAGLAVVTTTVGAQGLGAVAGEHLLIANEPDAFAQCVVELLGDAPKRQKLGAAGQSLVAELCSPIAANRVLTQMLHEIGATPASATFHRSPRRKRLHVSAWKFYVLRIFGSPSEEFFFRVRPALRFVYRRCFNSR